MADAAPTAPSAPPDRRTLRKAARKAADLERGYSISIKRLALAFMTEGVIVATSLFGAWLFATMYAGTDSTAFYMMLLAPLAYAAIEFSRVPLAVSLRTQPSLAIRIIAGIGVLGAAIVTVKSISQLGEIMFRPRLVEAVKAQEKLTDARNARASIDRKIADADAIVAQRGAQLADAERRLKDSNTELGALPPQRCFRTTSTAPDGRRVTGTRCTTDPRTEAMKTSLTTATKDRTDASAGLEKARLERGAFDRSAVDKALSDAEVGYRDAVMRSQLHSFTAMVFFKDPGQVSDEEIHTFLFFFVFIPAIGASIASTLLALTSIERVREEDDVVLDESAGSFILEPFADEIVAAARAEAERAAQATIDRNRSTPAPLTAEAPAAAPSGPAPAGPVPSGPAPLRVVETGR